MSRVGQLLIASPGRPDEFRRSLVLILREDEDLVTGAILNRPIGQSLKEVWSDLDTNCKCQREDSIYFGGPVFGPMHAIHKSPEFSEDEVLPGLYWSMTSDKLNQIVISKDSFRILTGYAKWDREQLENEIANFGWLVFPQEVPQFDIIFGTDPDRMYVPDVWKKGYMALSRQKWQQLGLNHVPTDVRLN